MCIIAIKNSGVAFPTDEVITNMWVNNPDGAGFMYTHDGKVIIGKGFMNLDGYLQAIHNILASDDIDPVDTPFILHCRITTHGGTCPECTHPFPITDNMAALRKTLVASDIGVAHNGIIRSVTPRDKHTSDTQEYIASVLAPIYKANRKFWQSKGLMQVITNTVGSKLAFLTGDGHICTIGKFETDKDTGLIFSNDSYKPRLYSWTAPATGYNSYFKGKVDSYPYHGGSTKVLMMLMDAPGKPRTFHTKDGKVMSAARHAVDNAGNLYRLDIDTNACYRVKYKPIEPLPKWSLHFADKYECYESESAYLASAWFDMPWGD